MAVKSASTSRSTKTPARPRQPADEPREERRPGARPIWTGNLRLALVSVPVNLYPATKTGAQISFHQIHEPSGKRIRYEKVVPGIGPVDTDEIVKGFEVDKGNYVLIDPEEMAAIKLASKKTQDLVPLDLRRVPDQHLSGQVRVIVQRLSDLADADVRADHLHLTTFR